MRIVFQGDSITDANRNRKDPNDLGPGYTKYVAEEISHIYPDIKFEFFNRGCGGHMTQNLLARWNEDCIDLKPDIVTLLIGVNDCWHYALGEGDYVPNDIFEKNFHLLLSRVKEETDAKIIVIEPYTFDREHLSSFRRDLEDKIRIERKVSRELADLYIPLDGIIAAQCVIEDSMLLSEDGVHPTEYGHQVISAYVTDAICTIIDDETEEK